MDRNDYYSRESVEWRFQQSLKDHREKLNALPEAQRKSVEEDLRKGFAEHERDFWALNGCVNYLEEVDFFLETHDKKTAETVDRAQEAWQKFQDQQKGADLDQDHGKERER
jgi:hypothetical protein